MTFPSRSADSRENSVVALDLDATSEAERSRLPFRIVIERVLFSRSGLCLIAGWLADEGCTHTEMVLRCEDAVFSVPASCVIRHQRRDVEASLERPGYDVGFIVLADTASFVPDALTVTVLDSEVTLALAPHRSSATEKRIMDAWLEICHGLRCCAGREPALAGFLSGAGGDLLRRLFSRHVDAFARTAHVERFGARAVHASQITVLFGSVEPMLMQPPIARGAGMRSGEQIYVCNSPELAEDALRIGEVNANLYDVPMTVIVLGDNVGFGAANNLAVHQAASHRIVLLNPDVYPIARYVPMLNDTLEQASFGSSLLGGLLFYDDDVLMHGGMRLERDRFFRRGGPGPAGVVPDRCSLLRVEHFDKGVPFDEDAWKQPRSVPAVTGALMAFERSCFEALGGFSGQYIYGHYEDADLSLRWRERGHDVSVHPGLRMIHLEGQGAKASSPVYAGAAQVNRHFFSMRHGVETPPQRNSPGSGRSSV